MMTEPNPDPPELTRSSLVKPFYPALDGMRAVAILAVMATHFGMQVWWKPMIWWGWVGVDFFFVLSGFLITGILFDSLARPAYFKTFYLRRALRIFPLYYGFWLFLFLLTPLLKLQWNAYVLSTFVYLGNFFSPGAMAGHHASPMVVAYRSILHPPAQRLITFQHFWSLCVEEQFYLVWPAVVFLLRSRKVLLRVCLGAIPFFPCLRLLVFYIDPKALPTGVLNFNTFTRMDTLLIGGALALWLRGPVPDSTTLRRQSRALTVAAILLLLAISRVGPSYGPYSFDQPLVATLGYTLIAVASASLLLLAISPGSFTSRLFKWKPLTAIGRISYGMYFLHDLFIDFFNGLLPRFRHYHLALVCPLFGFAVTYVLALLSFRYIESPFLQLKERFAARPGAVADPPPAGIPLHREHPNLSDEKPAMSNR